MCLIAFAWNKSPRHRLVLAANRDEFHDRPTLAARWWDDAPKVFGGRDLSAGGTWLALNSAGRLAAVTNFRERPHRGPGERSRGELATSFLTGGLTPQDHAAQLLPHAAHYGGFNLLMFDWSREQHACVYLSNRHTHSPLHAPADGIHTVSNHLLNTPWPKSERLSTIMAEAMTLHDPFDRLFDALADTKPVADSEIAQDADRSDPDVLTRTPFIFDQRYGTRASTVVVVDRDGGVRFAERTWRWTSNGPVCSGERRLTL